MHLYENRSPNHVSVVYRNEFGQFIHFTFSPFSKKEFEYPALDVYVPQHLLKVCDITGKLLFPNKIAKKDDVIIEAIINTVVEPAVIEYTEKEESIESIENLVKEELPVEKSIKEEPTPVKHKKIRKK